ncbi:MAG: hypothetical protein LUG89_05105 [Methanosphaera sp.]|nr:hypothetical protein [Methanosphaera sp.]
MDKWDKNKLEEMTKQGAEFSKHELNYTYISQKYEEMLKTVTLNGDVLPLEFNDVDVAYNGSLIDDYEKPEISTDLKEKIDEKESIRNTMHIKHFSRSISHQAWFDFIDNEVDEFIEKYPQYSDVIKN